MKSKVLLVSATIPHELASLPKIEISQKIKTDYLHKTRKNISFIGKNFTILQFHGKKTLLMLNTRRKATEIYKRVEDHYDSKLKKDDIFYYMSSGVRKKDRINIIQELTSISEEGKNGEKNCLVVSTQVIEAGVDVSFSEIYREAAPLDSIVQVMGRLNREGKIKDPTLSIFQIDEDWRPYSELEYAESLPILKQVTTSDELYNKLEQYYATISEKNQSNKEKTERLLRHVSNMDFDKVWEFVDKYALPDDGDIVYIPYNLKEWENIKSEFMVPENSKKDAYRKFANLTASLPKSIRPSLGDYLDYFDEDLINRNILLPKRRYFESEERLREIYHEKLGFDILLT
jgi:CRISPR/Cas system-associated endonuclease/helicase Cas3